MGERISWLVPRERGCAATASLEINALMIAGDPFTRNDPPRLMLFDFSRYTRIGLWTRVAKRRVGRLVVK